MSMMQHCFSEFLSQPLYQFEYKQLHGGFSLNSSYLYHVNDKKYVVRMLGESLHFRKSEIEAHLLAATLNVAPRVHYYDKNNYAFTIMDFIEGATLNLQQAQSVEVLNLVAHKVKLLAQVEVSTLSNIPKRDVFRYIVENYEMVMRNPEYAFLFPLLEDMFSKAKIIVNTIEKDNRSFVLSHNDLHSRNIFFADNDVLFIDWEMVGVTYQLYDLANYSFTACLSDEQDVFLLSKYLGCEPSHAELHQFRKMKLLAMAFYITSIFAWVEKGPSDFSLDNVKRYEDYAALFAHDATANSSDFLFLLGISALKEFSVRYDIV